MSLLLYPTVLYVLMIIYAGISYAPGHTSRFSLTFHGSTPRWYLCTLVAKSGCTYRVFHENQKLGLGFFGPPDFSKNTAPHVDLSAKDAVNERFDGLAYARKHRLRQLGGCVGGEPRPDLKNQVSIDGFPTFITEFHPILEL